MSPEELNELEELASRATPGPWELGDGWVFTEPVYEGDNRLASVHTAMKFMDEERATDERARIQANLEFIAAARTAVPALVAEVRMLRGQKRVNDQLAESSRLADRQILDLRARLEATENAWRKAETDSDSLRDAIEQLADEWERSAGRFRDAARTELDMPTRARFRASAIDQAINAAKVRALIQSDTGGTNE